MDARVSSGVLTSNHAPFLSNLQPRKHQTLRSISGLNNTKSIHQFSNASFHLCTPFSSRSHCVKQVVNISKDNSCEFELSTLTALSPLDGRYWGKVKDLAPYMSEYGLIYFRVLVEIKWLLMLSQIPEVIKVPSFSAEARSYLQGLVDGFSMDDALEVKKIEGVTNHDVKAVEYFLKQKCQSQPEISKVLEFFHFACTSEDINNLAHALMLKEAMAKVMFPTMDKLIEAISSFTYNLGEGDGHFCC